LHRRSGTTSSRSRTASRPRCAPSRSELLTKPRSTGRRPRSARPHVTPMRSRAPRNDPTPRGFHTGAERSWAARMLSAGGRLL